MTILRAYQAYAAAVHQARAALALEDIEGAKRALDKAVDEGTAARGRAVFNYSDHLGVSGPLECWQYRAERLSNHFVLHQRERGARGENGPYVLTHQPSGAFIADGLATRIVGRALHRALMNLEIDWSARTALELREGLSAIDSERIRRTVSAYTAGITREAA
jgi:hypothetical protein